MPNYVFFIDHNFFKGLKYAVCFLAGANIIIIVNKHFACKCMYIWNVIYVDVDYHNSCSCSIGSWNGSFQYYFNFFCTCV